ncbi:glutamate receptor ionotropic, kainate 3-like isoform X3 [Zootermopsis nevadensis]|nr:glutamate receptor ionotropic, kainate 3-like isoform X3 [Zootermopsis nevadensis]
MFSWWLLVMESGYEPHKTGYTTHTRFQHLQAGVGSHVNIVSFWSTLNEVTGVVWDAYKLGADAPLCTNFNAQWHYAPKRSGWGIFTQLPSYMDKLLARSHDMTSVILRVGVIVGKPDHGFDCRAELNKLGHIVAVRGYSAHILSTLIDLLHFKYAQLFLFCNRVEFVGSDSWGSQDDEGVWFGLLGMVAENVVDLMLCHPTVTADRTAAARFLHPTLDSRRMLAYRAAGLPLTQDVFILTFTGSLWLVCLLMALVLLAASFRVASLQTAKFLSEQPEPWTWVEITLWAVAATCQQGFSKEPQGIACKTVFITGYTASYLLYTWFAAGVTSLLAVQGQDTHLQLSDVAQMGTDFSASWDGLLPEFFMNSPDAAAQELYLTQLRRERNKVHILDQLFLQLHGDNKVCMASEHPLKHFMSTRLTADEACQLTLSPVTGTKHTKAWAVPQGSSYADILNYWLLRLREAGLLQLGLKRSMVTLTSCNNGSGYSSAGIGHVLSAVGILASGTMAALLLLIAEFTWHHHRHQ